MSYFWFLAFIVALIIIINKNSNIYELRNEIKKLKPSDQVAEQVNDQVNNINYNVDWETAAYLQERKIDSKYLRPLKNLENQSHFFYDKKVVITGVYDDYPDRNDLAKLFWEVGADIDVSVGKNTEYLIVGDDFGPLKIQKAKEQNITIIYQNELNKYFPFQENI